MAWVRVQTSTEQILATGAGAGGTTKGVAMTVTAGNTIVAWIVTWKAASADSGIATVTGGGTWANLISDASGTFKVRNQISFCANTTGGAITVTVTIPATADIVFIVAEFSGGNTPTSGVTHAGTGGLATTSVSSGASTAATAGDLVLGIYGSDGENEGTITATGTVTTVEGSFPASSSPSMNAVYTLAGTAVAQTASFSYTGAADNPEAVVGTLHVGGGAAARQQTLSLLGVGV